MPPEVKTLHLQNPYEQFHTKVNPTAKKYISANAQFKVFCQ